MSEILRAVVSAVPGDPEDMQVELQTDATPLDILIGLAAITREIWREISADDPTAGALFRVNLVGAFSDPAFWRREGEASDP